MFNSILDLFDDFKVSLATKSLKRNLQDFDSHADKGNNVVIFVKSPCIHKVHSLLHDNSTHQKQRSSPYLSVTKSFLRNLKGIADKCQDLKFFGCLRR